MASPRPGTSGNSSRPPAYKSPAVKTPASLHGHHVSVSSQPSSTPLGGIAIHDDLLGLNSPAAALLNSLGPTGLTPLGNATDGLGITTSSVGGQVRSTGQPANPELERVHRLQLVAETLKKRVGGHGVTRDGVARIAQLQGFETHWDDDNLTIAGNCVDLEINFAFGGGDGVRDVSLKLNILENTSESEEPQFQEQGTLVVKDNLQGSGVRNSVSQWRSLDAFASNLRYLGQLDRIETGSPCFNAVGDLNTTFQMIWNAEKDRLQGRTTWQHLRQGAVGRPVMDRKPKLGLALDYWASGNHQALESGTEADGAVNQPGDIHTAQISCEAGLPSTAMIKKWVSKRVLQEDTESMLDVDSVSLTPDWEDPAQDSGGVLSNAEPDQVAIEKVTDSSPSILDLHFYCALLPEVYLPLNVAANLNLEIAMLNINPESTLTYQAALQKHCTPKDVDGNKSVTTDRWLRSLPIPTKANPEHVRKHSYALHSTQNAPALWCYPVNHLNFTHPKQISRVLHVLRQYVVLWRILRSLVVYTGRCDAKASKQSGSSTRTSDAPARPLKRSNQKAPGAKLEDLLKKTATLKMEDPLPIDLTLDFISDLVKARLDIYIPLIASPSRQKRNAFIFLGLWIGQGGVIEIRDLRGLPSFIVDTSYIHKKIIRILEATEDVGMLVEWLLEQAFGHG